MNYRQFLLCAKPTYFHPGRPLQAPDGSALLGLPVGYFCSAVCSEVNLSGPQIERDGMGTGTRLQKGWIPLRVARDGGFGLPRKT